MGGHIKLICLSILLVSAEKCSGTMELGDLVQLNVDTLPPLDLDPQAIDDEIDYLMDYTITLMMNSMTAERDNTSAKARAQMMIELGMQLLEIQDILYSKLEAETQKPKKTWYEGLENSRKHKFSQVRM